MPKYFSKRGKPLSTEMPLEFWRAFKAYVQELYEREWLIAEFGNTCFQYELAEERFFIDNDLINRKMLQEIGKALFPLGKMPEEETIFDLIEFFFKYVCINPDKQRNNILKARYEYTIRINRLFDNFNLAYCLKNGEVKALHSGFIDKQILNEQFAIPDRQTQELLDVAIEKFYSRKQSERKIGLEKLVDVYQRISSWEDKKDKKKSVGKMLDKISSGDHELKGILNDDYNDLWKIANTFMIRHTELNQRNINDEDVVEYLFYQFYNSIRLILKKYHYVLTRPSEEI